MILDVIFGSDFKHHVCVHGVLFQLLNICAGFGPGLEAALHPKRSGMVQTLCD